MSHSTYMTVSCLTYEWGMAHMWMSHVTHLNCHVTHVTHVNTHIFDATRAVRCDGVMSHMWMGHGTHMNASCHTCKWVMVHIYSTQHAPHAVNESCHTCEHRYFWVNTDIFGARRTERHKFSGVGVRTHIWMPPVFMKQIYLIQDAPSAIKFPV